MAKKTTELSKKEKLIKKPVKEEKEIKKENKAVDTEKSILVPEKKACKISKVTITMLIMVALTVLLTWILKTSSYDGVESIVVGERIQTGIFDMFSRLKDAFSIGSSTAVYLLIIGGFYGVLYKTGAYRTLLNKIADAFRGSKNVFLIISIILIAVLTSVCGASIAFLMIVPLLISVITLLGYDRSTAALTIIGAIAVGLIGTTVSSTLMVDPNYGSILASNNMGIINEILGTIAKNQLFIKIGILVFGILFLIGNVIANIHFFNKKDCANNNDAEIFAPKTVVEGKKAWPLILVIDFTIIIALLSVVSWTKVFNVTWFTEATAKVLAFTISSIPLSAVLLVIVNCLLFIRKKIVKKVILIIDAVFVALLVVGILLNAIFGISLITEIFAFAISKLPLIGKAFASTTELGAFPIFNKLFGTINEFGSWTATEFSALLVVMACVVGIIYRVRFGEFIKGFIEGAKRAIKPATMVVFSYLVLVIVFYSPIVLTIVKPLVGSGLNSFTMSLTAFVTNLFNVDLAYSAPALLQYIAQKYTDPAALKAIALIWQIMGGITVLIAPTSIVLMPILSYLHVSFIKWIKTAFFFILGMLLVSLLLVTILVLLI